jgi:ATP-binding cassette subfamily B protein
MTSNVQNIVGPEPTIPARWAADVDSRLGDGEQVQAWLETDLDQDLKFANGLVLVTNRRLLAQAAGQTAWLEWSLAAGLKLNHHDQAGVGALELVDDHGRWRPGATPWPEPGCPARHQ